jgi:exopolysaccharide biosynthesis polyprenyl glycosylphosphotransferase
MAATSHEPDIGRSSNVSGATIPRRSATGVRYKRRLMIADACALAIGTAAAFIVQLALKPVPLFVMSDHLALALLTVPGFAVGAVGTRMYQARANERPMQEHLNIVRSVATWVGALVVVAFGLKYSHLSRFWVVLLAVCTSAALTAERHMARRIFGRLRVSGRMKRRIVIVGTDAHAVGLMRTYEQNPALGYSVVGLVGDGNQGEGVDVIGALDDLPRILDEHDANGVLVSQASVHQQDVNALARRLTDGGYHVALSSCLKDIDITRLRPQQLDGRTMLYIEPVIRNGWRALAKRGFDLAIALVIIVLTVPVLLVAMVAIKLDSRGPVFFRQARIGRDGRRFTMTKLRTMVVDAEARKAELIERNEADGPLFKIADDPRVTRVGRVLRKLSIDELPQLISVLKGDMSIVGPRPALPEEVDGWDDSLHDRLRVLPGVTGMWQVSGRSETSFEQYRRLDLYYVDNWTLAHDVRICARTVGVVLTGRGAA